MMPGLCLVVHLVEQMVLVCVAMSFPGNEYLSNCCCCQLPQAACTPKELKELVTMPSIAVHAMSSQLTISESDQAEMKAVRLKRRIYELISNVGVPGFCLATGPHL